MIARPIHALMASAACFLGLPFITVRCVVWPMHAFALALGANFTIVNLLPFLRVKRSCEPDQEKVASILQTAYLAFFATERRSIHDIVLKLPARRAPSGSTPTLILLLPILAHSRHGGT